MPISLLARALPFLVSLALLPVASADQFRPALVGNGPKALVNLIDTQKLMAKGQRTGAVMFECYVDEHGQPSYAMTYRGTPNSKALNAEVRAKLDRCLFLPAVYDGKPIGVNFVGTALLVVADGKPHLRIYANQNPQDVKEGSDFVAPQLIAGTTDWATAKTYLETARLHAKNGAVELAISVDAVGNIKDMKVTSEDPPNYNFGRSALVDYAHAKFIPGFRNGRPVACTFNYTDFVWITIRLTKEERLRASLIPER